MKALVSMSFSPTSIFVVRRLHDLGYDVTAVDSQHKSYASFSNAVSRSIVAPSLHDDPLGFARCILAELRRNQYDIFVPVFECSFLMADFLDSIREYTRMVSMPFASIREAHSKFKLQELGRCAGVKVIENTLTPHSMEDVEAYCRSVSGPVVIKGQSTCNAHGQVIVFDPADLFNTYQKLVLQEGWQDRLPVIQPYIRGQLVSSVNLAHQGEKTGGVIFKALRTVPVAGGTSSYRETIDCPICSRYDEQLIKALDWTGFICFDYMQEEKTGEFYLIDCNPRMAPGLALGYFAGVDLIGGYLDIARGVNAGTLPQAVAGVRSKLQFLDFNWLLSNLQDENLAASAKWQCFCQWIKPHAGRGDIASWRDLRPAFELYRYLLTHLAELRGEKGGQVFYRHALFDEAIYRDQLAMRS